MFPSSILTILPSFLRLVHFACVRSSLCLFFRSIIPFLLNIFLFLLNDIVIGRRFLWFLCFLFFSEIPCSLNNSLSTSHMKWFRSRMVGWIDGRLEQPRKGRSDADTTQSANDSSVVQSIRVEQCAGPWPNQRAPSVRKQSSRSIGIVCYEFRQPQILDRTRFWTARSPPSSRVIGSVEWRSIFAFSWNPLLLVADDRLFCLAKASRNIFLAMVLSQNPTLHGCHRNDHVALAFGYDVDDVYVTPPLRRVIANGGASRVVIDLRLVALPLAITG